MKRAILAPADLAGAPLIELKDWLAISTARDDEALLAQLSAALDMCEAFTRQMPLEAECEEVLTASSGWQDLVTRPVQSVTQVESIAADGTRSALSVNAYEVELDEGGGAQLRLLGTFAAVRIAVRFTAGIAPDWATLPAGIKQGILRLAAHNFAARQDQRLEASPPAAIIALWQPWRRMRLA